MHIYIDPTGGIAGDMFSAMLISSGASKEILIKGMIQAGNKLGETEIDIDETKDGSTRMHINFHSNHTHLKASKAIHLLHVLFDELAIEEKYRDFGIKALDILIEAEKKAHQEHHFQALNYHKNDETYLHEAQDIIIDIIGASLGMQNLHVETKGYVIEPVSAGGGMVKFSHGKLPVPAPATKNILNKFNIPYNKGPIETELCTPTGIALLAALDVELVKSPNSYIKTGCARGSKDIDVPPLKVYIV